MKRILTKIMYVTLIVLSVQMQAGVGDYAASLWNVCKQIPVRSTIAKAVGNTWNALINHPYIAAGCAAVIVGAGCVYAKKNQVKAKMYKAYSDDHCTTNRSGLSKFGQSVRRLYKIRANDPDTALRDALEKYESAFKEDVKEEITKRAIEISDLLKKKPIMTILLAK